MHIVVCVKQIPNPEAAFSMFSVDERANKVVPASGLQLVMSPFDEQAVEAALRVREQVGEARITILSVGPDSARNVLKHGLAMGADDGVLVCDPLLDDPKPEVTAAALAGAIRAIGPVDLVLTGRQAADWDAGIVGCGVAELLGLPVITFACNVEASADLVRVERVLADGTETLEAQLPVLVTVSNEIGAARKPNLRETMKAARKPVVVRTALEVGLTAEAITSYDRRRVRERVFAPPKQAACELIAGDGVMAQAEALVARLRDARIV